MQVTGYTGTFHFPYYLQ